MPMIDAVIPENALTPQAKQALLCDVTDLVISHEIGDPENERARNATWIFVHRPLVFVAGVLATSPRYRFIVSVPEGQFDAARRQIITAQVTAAIAKAEGRKLDEVKGRVRVITAEIPDGTWGARGRIIHLPEILTSFLGGARHAQVPLRGLVSERVGDC